MSRPITYLIIDKKISPKPDKRRLSPLTMRFICALVMLQALWFMGFAYFSWTNAYDKSQQPAFYNLSVEENIVITKELQKRSIPFRLKNNGREIYIPALYQSKIRDIAYF